jgi:guanine nucleotide-binding protein subunit alpha
LYTPSAFREERILWRAVIQLNLVKSIRTILDALVDHHQSVIVGSTSGGEDSDSDDMTLLSDDLHGLSMRLSPLRHIEHLLIAKLVPPGEDEATHFGVSSFTGKGVMNGERMGNGHSPKYQEVFVRPGASWKGMVAKGRGFGFGGRPSSAGTTGIETQDEPTMVLYECRHDMKELWNNSLVRDVLRRRKIRLDEQPGLCVQVHLE